MSEFTVAKLDPILKKNPSWLNRFETILGAAGSGEPKIGEGDGEPETGEGAGVPPGGLAGEGVGELKTGDGAGEPKTGGNPNGAGAGDPVKSRPGGDTGDGGGGETGASGGRDGGGGACGGVFVRTEGITGISSSSFGFNKMYAITATATNTQTPIIIHVL